MIDLFLNAEIFTNDAHGYLAASVVRAVTMLLAILALKRMLTRAWRASRARHTSLLAAIVDVTGEFWRDRAEVKIGLVLIITLLLLQILNGPGANPPKTLTVYQGGVNVALQLIFFGLSRDKAAEQEAV